MHNLTCFIIAHYNTGNKFKSPLGALQREKKTSDK